MDSVVSEGLVPATFLAREFCQEKARLQGVGDREMQKYSMQDLSDNQLSDFAGNSRLGLSPRKNWN